MLKVAPIAVYTSGKGSSAAGLTASVQRDAVSVGFAPLNDFSKADLLNSGNFTLKVAPWSWQILAWSV